MIRQITALVAALTIAALASGSHAATVSFQVISGMFGSDAAGANVTHEYTSGSGHAFVSFAANTATQSFSGVNDNQTLTITNFGTFSVTGTGSSNVGIDDTFTLTIMLIDPASATGGTMATLDGSLQNGQGNKDLTITFPAAGLTLPSSGLPDVVFKFTAITNLSEVSGQSSATLGGTATYQPAPASAAPLPGVAAAGFCLLGLTALARLRKSPATA
jgi:hypothetical protein